MRPWRERLSEVSGTRIHCRPEGARRRTVRVAREVILSFRACTSVTHASETLVESALVSEESRRRSRISPFSLSQIRCTPCFGQLIAQGPWLAAALALSLGAPIPLLPTLSSAHSLLGPTSSNRANGSTRRSKGRQ
jgi:hypothetical protein